MQMNHAHAYVADVADAAFDSVWGNALQREDFLALAAGVRQFSLEMTHLALVSTTQLSTTRLSTTQLSAAEQTHVISE